MKKSVITSYFLIIGIMIGIEFAAGALVAPIIFYPAQFIGEGVLSHFQSGILMTQIFIRFNTILFFSVILLWLFEFYMYVKINKDKFSLVLLMVITISALLFIYYFTPYIIEAQKLGAKVTQNEDFNKMHKLSEIDMKVLMIAQISLFFKRLMGILKK